MSTRTMERGASIDILGATKRYGDFVALNDISLHIEPGEFMTLLGPSGSGKTTTLNIIAGFTDLSAGDLAVGGESIVGLPAHKRNIGVVFQHYALFPHMTVGRNVAYALALRGVKKVERERRVAYALDMVKMVEFAHRYPSELSGGQQQRVALARAIVFDPPLLLMDEPLGALDKKLREWLQLEIKRIHRQLGTTFVYVIAEVGVWECTPGRFTASRDTNSETCHIVSGRVSLHGPEGRIQEVSAGEMLVRAGGANGRSTKRRESCTFSLGTLCNSRAWCGFTAGCKPSYKTSPAATAYGTAVMTGQHLKTFAQTDIRISDSSIGTRKQCGTLVEVRVPSRATHRSEQERRTRLSTHRRCIWISPHF